MQNNHGTINDKDILKIICDLANSIRFNRYLNESYLHHAFSYKLQKQFPDLELSNQLMKKQQDMLFHPEWATYRELDKLNDIQVPQYRKYKKYLPQAVESSEGKGAAFDFTIGNYNCPSIGIEFKWKYDWEKGPIFFDFVKCLDKQFTCFDTTISFNIVMREKRDGDYLKDDSSKHRFKQVLKDAYNDAISVLIELDSLTKDNRNVYLIITEIAKDNDRLHWHYDKKFDEFIVGFPN